MDDPRVLTAGTTVEGWKVFWIRQPNGSAYRDGPARLGGTGCNTFVWPGREIEAECSLHERPGHGPIPRVVQAGAHYCGVYACVSRPVLLRLFGWGRPAAAVPTRPRSVVWVPTIIGRVELTGRVAEQHLTPWLQAKSSNWRDKDPWGWRASHARLLSLEPVTFGNLDLAEQLADFYRVPLEPHARAQAA